jgi:hypothetical protein
VTVVPFDRTGAAHYSATGVAVELERNVWVFGAHGWLFSSSATTTGEMFSNRDWCVGFHCTFAVCARAAVIAKELVARSTVYRHIIFTHAHCAGRGCTAIIRSQQPQHHHVIQQSSGGFDGDLAAARAGEGSLHCGIPLQLYRTPTAGLVKALVQLQMEQRHERVSWVAAKYAGRRGRGRESKTPVHAPVVVGQLALAGTAAGRRCKWCVAVQHSSIVAPQKFT